MVAPAGHLRRSRSFVCLFVRLFAPSAALTTPPARAGLEGSVGRRFVGSLTRGAVFAAFLVVRALPRPRRVDGGFRLRDDFCMGPSKNDTTSASHHPRPHQRCCAAGPIRRSSHATAMLALPTNASPFCRNLNNANVEHLMGACAPRMQSSPKMSGAATFCGST